MSHKHECRVFANYHRILPTPFRAALRLLLLLKHESIHQANAARFWNLESNMQYYVATGGDEYQNAILSAPMLQQASGTNHTNAELVRAMCIVSLLLLCSSFSGIKHDRRSTPMRSHSHRSPVTLLAFVWNQLLHASITPPTTTQWSITTTVLVY